MTEPDAGQQRRRTSARLAQGDNTATRVVAVIDALARCAPEGVGVRELAAQLNVSRSATNRILLTLNDLHVARSLPTGGYGPGALLVAWSAFLAERHSLLSAAEDVLARLVDLSEETCYIFSYLPGDDFATIVNGRQSDKPVRYVLELGSVAPLHVGAAGKAILAHLPEEFVPTILGAGSRSPRDIKGLERDLATIRERGYSVSVGERIQEACGVAAPFFANEGIAGSITITIPRYRFDAEHVPELGAAVAQAAMDLSRLLAANPHGGDTEAC